MNWNRIAIIISLISMFVNYDNTNMLIILRTMAIVNTIIDIK